MNVIIAARNTLRHITDTDPHRSNLGEGLAHACWMLHGVADGYIQNEKAHRWLGYAQAIIVVETDMTLNDMKTINQNAAE